MGTNTGIGIGIGIPFRGKHKDSGGIILPPELKEVLCGVWIADQNTNESPTRNIIKNKITNAGGDFEILNAAYKGNSGYGIYKDIPFTQWIKETSRVESSTSLNTVHITKIIKLNLALYYYIVSSNKVRYKVSGVSADKSIKFGFDGANATYSVVAKKDGIYEVDWDLNLYTTGNKAPNCIIAEGTTGDCDITIEQIPYYQGAFCTDGVDDLIVSQKSVSEMLGGSNELTVVSMVHQIAPINNATTGMTNYIRNANHKFIRNNVLNIGKTGIYGYTVKDSTTTVINNILGDKNDYNVGGTLEAIDAKFSVEGDYIHKVEFSQIAWYWTLIAKRVLTTDEINQVIAYYNLDKYVAPDIYYDVKKQGLTNDNHADFGDKLIDYSGNGKDMHLYNFGWKLDSGVGKYEEDFNKWTKYPNVITNDISISTNSDFVLDWLVYKRASDNPIKSIRIRVNGVPENGRLIYRYAKQNDSISATEFPITEDGIYELPESKLTTAAFSVGFSLSNNNWTNIVIEQLPSFEGALVFDGVDDYGQYVGDLGLKDYTVVADREYVELIDRQVPIISNTAANTTTPFIFEFSSPLPNVKPFSFNSSSTNIAKPIDTNRKVSYQSTYIYNGDVVTKGTLTSAGSGLTFGRYGANQQYAKLCLYNFMLFPYSLSEFLIERQLKKRNLGTLYPDIPYKVNVTGLTGEFSSIRVFNSDGIEIVENQYYSIGTKVIIYVKHVYYNYPNNGIPVVKLNGEELEVVERNEQLGIGFSGILSNKDVQTIDIIRSTWAVDYIEFERLLQFYPAFVTYQDSNGKEYSWGDKIKITNYEQGLKVKTITNLLPEICEITRYRFYEGANKRSYTEEELKEYIFNADNSVEKPTCDYNILIPNVYKRDILCVLSPERLKLPNITYLRLGYIPDISGNNNHGIIFNSGKINIDGSYQFDGIDDYVRIVNLIPNSNDLVPHHIIMKVNPQNINKILYDQRRGSNTDAFAIFNADDSIAYNSRNNGKTYIDGILNTTLKSEQLLNVIHNITIANYNSDKTNTNTPVIGSNSERTNYFAKMSLYTFMAFYELSNDEVIVKLNEIIKTN